MDVMQNLCTRFELDLKKELEILQKQGDAWQDLRGKDLARQIRDDHGIDAVVNAVQVLAPELGFTPLPVERLRENISNL